MNKAGDHQENIIIKNIQQQWKSVLSIFDSNMYLLWLHIQSSIVQTKYYFNITVAFQIFAKYIIFNIFFSVSVSKTTPFVSNDLEKIRGKGITLK